MMIYQEEEQIIAEIIRKMSRLFPNKPAIISGATTLTYQELDAQSSALANAMIAHGIAPQSRVAYLGKESECYYVLLFACAKANIILVPINWRLKANEVAYILSDSNSAILFIDAEHEFILKDIQPLPSFIVSLDAEKVQSYKSWLAEFIGKDPNLSITPDQAFVQLYTSGTTGLPKGVVLANNSFFKIRNSLLANQLNWIDWQETDISLIGIPGFHVGGLWWSLQGFSSGITQVCMPAFHASVAIDLITTHQITIACLVPAMIQMILRECTNMNLQLSHIRKIVYGGSPISETLLKESLELFNCEFAQIYGLTETGNTAICLPPHAHIIGSKLLTATGIPYPCVQVEIRDEDGHCLPAYAIGEIFLNSPAAMKEYWQLPDKTQETLQQGWLKTGDAGYLDEEGYLFVCDRIKDMIIVAGEKIYPAEVENALVKHPLIDDAAVVGTPHQEWGESIRSFIVTKQSLKPFEIIRFLKQHIADYKIPTDFIVVDKIPRNPSGKILKRELIVN